MTQNPTNNPYGAYLEAKIELDSRIASAVGLQKEQLNINSGFLNWSPCIVEDPLTKECLKRDPNIKTPGTVIKSQLDKVLPSGLERLISLNHVEQLVNAVAAGLLQRYVFGPKGLFNKEKDTNTGGGTADIDGDGIIDGLDSDGNGTLDICYYGGVSGGTAPPCLGSVQALSTEGGSDQLPTDNTNTTPPETPPSGQGVSNESATVQQIASGSANWATCQATGNEVYCFRFLTEVARTLASKDSAWGLVTKGSGEHQCTLNACGGNVSGGYASDVVAYLPAGAPTSDWLGYDIIAGAGAPGASLTWNGPLVRRSGNNWAPSP